jgi:phosphoribosyl-dephospho-CoA transferase
MPPEVRTHALLRIAHPSALVGTGALPAWAEAALSRAPWVVVRRAGSREGLIPIGVRGSHRTERLAAWLHADAVIECLTPPELAARGGWRSRAHRAQVPALASLETVAALLRRHGLTWGPCGSVGFELASGVATVTAGSDLDLMVEARTALPRAAAVELRTGLAQLPVRADVLLEGPQGAVALEEYASGRAPVMLRTADGPRFVRDPWAAAPAAAA